VADDQANQQTGADDAADPRQNVPRTGIPGKGFDAGTGYGGGGNESLYSAESSYGGQSGIGGSRTIGAYAGEGYGRSGPGEGQSAAAGSGSDAGEGSAPNAARDTDGRGAANAGERPADPNTEAVTEAFEGRGGGTGDLANADTPASGISRDGPDAVDLDDFSGGSRREPGR
jgi:hypothetical protein